MPLIEPARGTNTPIDGTDITIYNGTEADIETVLKRKVGVSYADDWKSKNWKSVEGPFHELISAFFVKHEVGSKAGASFTQGTMSAGQRVAKNAVTNYFLGYDIDSGEPLEDMMDKIVDRGLFALLYTTHSHGKEETAVKRDVIVEYFKRADKETIEGEIRAAHLLEYLQDERHYHHTILGEAEYLGEDLREGGLHCIVKHPPMDKYRVLFVLKEPFDFLRRCDTQKEAVMEWRERYVGFGAELGAEFDTQTIDACRLFYLPRHQRRVDPDYGIFIVPGETLDIETVSRISPRDYLTSRKTEGLNPFQIAGGAGTGGGGQSHDFTNSWIMSFLGKHARGFRAADFMSDLYDGSDDLIPMDEGKVCVPCPNAHSHSDDNKTGFWVANHDFQGGDNFAMACSHQGCAIFNDRAVWLDMIVSDFNLKEDDLLAYVDEFSGDETYELDERGLPIRDDAPEGTTRRKKKKKKTDDDFELREGNPFNFSGVEDITEHLTEVLAEYETLSDMDESFLAEALAKSDLLETQIDKACTFIKNKYKIGLSALKKTVREFKPTKQERKKKKDKALYRNENVIAALQECNERWAVLSQAQGKYVMIKEHPKNGVDQMYFWTYPRFEEAFRNETINVVEGEDVKEYKLTELWWNWPTDSKGKDRRTHYTRIVFNPDPRTQRPEHYNLWEGFPARQERFGVGDWPLLEHHLYNNICHANDEWYEWLLTWFADIFQRPWARMGSSIVLKGKKGVGKSVVFEEAMDILLGDLMHVIQKSKDLFGDFNPQLSGRLLVILEEAVWGGNKANDGVLKGLISGKDIDINAKFTPQRTEKNFMRFVILSNEDWVVPASLDDERRYFVLQVKDDYRKDFDYFGPLVDEMRNGGAEAFMLDMMAWEPPGGDWDILRDPPETPWLNEQAMEGLAPHEDMLFDLIRSGSLEDPNGDLPDIYLHDTQETMIVVSDLYQWYQKECSKTAQGRFKSSGTAFGKAVYKLLGIQSESRRIRQIDNQPAKKTRVYMFPPATELREQYGHLIYSEDQKPEMPEATEFAPDGTPLT